MAECREHTSGLASRLLDRVREEFPEAERLGNPKHRLPHILSMRIPDVVGATLLERMNAHGVAFSTGSACHDAGGDSENPVLKAAGFSKREAREVIRVSFCRENTVEEIDRVGDLLVQEASFLRRVAPDSKRKVQRR